MVADSSSSPSIPFWGSSMATAMKSSIQNSSSTGGGASTDRVLGAAASLGLCLAILRVVGFSYTASRHLENGESKDKPSSPSKSSSATISHFLLSYVRHFLKKMLLEDDVDSFDDNFDDNLHPNRSSSITHAGSCHCGCVVFEVVAPRRLQARDGVGKIQYRHTKAKTSDFQVFKGQKYLKTYYIRSDSSYDRDRGAHAFCQQCGVHILYAPWKNSPHIFINVNCLGQGVRKVKSREEIDSIIDAVPADMDNQSTVSTVSGDSRWNLFLQHHDSSNSTLHDDVSISDYSYTRKPHQVSISQSLTAQTEMSSASSMTRIGSDDSTVRSYKSAKTTGSISLQPLHVPISTQHVSPAEQNLSPAMRDQMKKYMSRHLGGEKKTGGDRAKTIQTMKKQTIHSVSRAAVGEHNKYI
ncbi:unnamed protein product [Cylindrotheca closterium]|uniref:CENP-V/GFA domain-containing protein n=1 Tax=Cylindrotheca closterium TaxID=2856 RepID=A0AAD2CPT7_9STRA|nr:unnamed protein product [Cylindrotheca closterium]